MAGVNGEVRITGETQDLHSQGTSEVWLQAPKSNKGKVYVGFNCNGVGITVPDGITDVSSGFELQKGDSIGPIKDGNLKHITFIGTDAGDSLIYFATTS